LLPSTGYSLVAYGALTVGAAFLQLSEGFISPLGSRTGYKVDGELNYVFGESQSLGDKEYALINSVDYTGSLVVMVIKR